MASNEGNKQHRKKRRFREYSTVTPGTADWTPIGGSNPLIIRDFQVMVNLNGFPAVGDSETVTM